MDDRARIAASKVIPDLVARRDLFILASLLLVPCCAVDPGASLTVSSGQSSACGISMGPVDGLDSGRHGIAIPNRAVGQVRPRRLVCEVRVGRKNWPQYGRMGR